MIEQMRNRLLDSGVPVTREPLLEMVGIEKSFPGVKALAGVTFAVQKGEVHGLVGENGAGKSTLMRILAGVFRATAGRILFDGEELHDPSPAEMLSRGVAVIYQEFAQAEHLSVAENIFLNRLPLSRAGLVDWKKARDDSARLLESLGVQIPARALVGDLSVAQRQMVEIARAISRDARLIVLDEPTAVLGDREVDKLFETIRALQAKGISFVYISHRLKEVFEICQTVTVIRDGAVVRSAPLAQWTTASLIQNMVGRPLSDFFPARSPRIGDVVLDVRGLRRGKAVKDVSFTVRAGEIVGLCGLAGAGRTEILRAIVGADRLDAGQIRLHGNQVVGMNPAIAVRSGLGFAPEDRKHQGLFLSHSIAFNVTSSRLEPYQRGGVLSLTKERKAVADLIGKFRVKAPGPATRVGTLSGGNQQKCVLAKQVNAACKVLIVDEPTRGVDVGAKREIYDLLVDLTEREGLAILMVSSELPEILGLCDRILVVREGSIVKELDGASATEEEIMRHATTH